MNEITKNLRFSEIERELDRLKLRKMDIECEFEEAIEEVEDAILVLRREQREITSERIF